MGVVVCLMVGNDIRAVFTSPDDYLGVMRGLCIAQVIMDMALKEMVIAGLGNLQFISCGLSTTVRAARTL